MKNRLPIIALLFCLLASSAFFVGCNRQKNDMSRDEKLLLLDAKIKKNPKDATLYYERGKIFLELKKVNNAIQDFTKAIQLDDDEVEYYTALGDAHFMNGSMGDSYSALQKALKLEPDNLEALLKMGEISFYSKDYDRSLETLSKVTKLDPNNRTAFFMKGYIYMEKGDTANAVRFYRKVIDIDPNFERAYEELGILYAQEKNILGVEYLATAIQLEPKNINALYALAMLYQDVEEPEKANELYVKILEIDPKNKFAWHNRGYIQMVLYEDYDAAIDFYTKALDCDNQYVEAHTNRGLAYELKGDKTNARNCFKAALQIDPNFEQARKGLERVK